MPRHGAGLAGLDGGGFDIGRLGVLGRAGAGSGGGSGEGGDSAGGLGGLGGLGALSVGLRLGCGAWCCCVLVRPSRVQCPMREVCAYLVGLAGRHRRHATAALWGSLCSLSHWGWFTHCHCLAGGHMSCPPCHAMGCLWCLDSPKWPTESRVCAVAYAPSKPDQPAASRTTPVARETAW